MTVNAKRSMLFALFLASACNLCAAAETDRPVGTGLRSPSIVAIRAIYQSIEHDIAVGRFKPEQRYASPDADGCRRYGEQLTIYPDAAGTVRKYVVEPDGQDSSWIVRHYYDLQRRLRFVFMTGGAVNGTRLEHRIYFDESGARIREDHTLTAGPGWTFWSAEDLAEDEKLAEDPWHAYERTCSADRDDRRP